jgi:hypothetical protein
MGESIGGTLLMADAGEGRQKQDQNIKLIITMDL